MLFGCIGGWKSKQGRIAPALFCHYHGPEGNRTLDLLSAIETRSQLRYRPISKQGRGIASPLFVLKRVTGFEPVTYSLARNRSTSLSHTRIYT